MYSTNAKGLGPSHFCKQTNCKWMNLCKVLYLILRFASAFDSGKSKYFQICLLQLRLKHASVNLLPRPIYALLCLQLPGQDRTGRRVHLFPIKKALADSEAQSVSCCPNSPVISLPIMKVSALILVLIPLLAQGLQVTF